ncbi:MAG TPA: hypothetical protein VJ739_00860 [Gemmataceae bacterium]|nr:hypothetical protein [Gemmataceae bacterium]
MTEAEWLSSNDPDTLLRYLHGRRAAGAVRWLVWLGFGKAPVEEAGRERASERKRRLFACACCRRIERLFLDERSLAAVEAAERYADGLLGEWARQEAEEAARAALAQVQASSGIGTDPTGLLLSGSMRGTRPAQLAAFAAAEAVGTTPCEAAAGAAVAAATQAAIELGDAKWAAAALGAVPRAALLREIFGNPFRPPAADPAWLSWNDGTVRRLAEAIYAERRFADLPILADALEEAGCADAALLDHLRGPGPHVLGCWALDALLQKE